MKWKRHLLIGVCLLISFVIWTILLQHIDVAIAGETEKSIGFATFNVWFHQLTGANMVLYSVTDWLGFVPIIICFGFAVLGLVQLIQRRSLFKVDLDILFLGAYYILVIFFYLLFEMIPINYRPILIEGRIEASYPSSTTLLVLSVMPTLVFQMERRAKKRSLRIVTAVLASSFSAFMVIGRLISGVHWATDIIASILLSAGLFMLYWSIVDIMDKKKDTRVKGNGIQ